MDTILIPGGPVPGHRLRVVAPDVGGSFGSKGSLYPEELLICIVARKLRRSVKWTADRLEDLSSSSQAFAEIIDAEMGGDLSRGDPRRVEVAHSSSLGRPRPAAGRWWACSSCSWDRPIPGSIAALLPMSRARF